MYVVWLVLCWVLLVIWLVMVGCCFGWGGISLVVLECVGVKGGLMLVDIDGEDMVVILFISGFIGVFKGVVYCYCYFVG